MTAALGLLWFLGVVSLWAVLSGMALILWRFVGEPLLEMVANVWRDSRFSDAWPWWV